MTKSFNKLRKNPVFGPLLIHFLKFWGKKIFSENLALSRTTSYGFLAPCQNLEKTNDKIPRKCRAEGQTESWTDPIL